MTSPAISVVVACRNERGRLGHCLDALARQDFPQSRLEIIVVDGGSTDGSREEAVRAGVRLFDDGAMGAAGARNLGIRAASAPVVAFTDADCIPRDDWATRIAEVFAEQPDLGGVAGSLRMPRGTLLGRLEDIEAQAYYRGFITSNVAYRKDVLLAVGGFDEALVCAEDYDLAWRVQDAGYRIVHDPRPVVVHAPPEIGGSLWTYLRKHYWYAKNDVPANLRAARRVSRGDAAGSATGISGMLHAAGDASIAAALLAAPGAPLAARVAAGAGAVAAYRRVSQAARQCAEPREEVPRMAAIVAARKLARGLGTLAGVASLAAPSRRRQLTGRGLATRLGPAAPRAGSPRAAATPRPRI